MELVFTIISKILKVPVENISIDSTSDTIENWDSLGHMNLILALEEELQISFDDEQIVNMFSVRSIIDNIKKQSAANE